MINRKELKELSKEQLRGQWGTVVLITLAITVIQLLANWFDTYYESSIIFTILSLAVSITVPIFTFSLYLKLTRGVKVKFTDMFVSGSTFLKSLGVTLLEGLIILPAIIIESIILVILGFFIAGSSGIFDTLLSSNSMDQIFLAQNIEELLYSIDFGALFKVFVIIMSIAFIIAIPIMILGYYMYPAIILMVEDNTRGVGECISTSFRLMKGNLWSFIVLQLSFIGWALLCILTLGIGFLWLTPYMETVNMNFFNKISGYNHTQGNPEQLIY